MQEPIEVGDEFMNLQRDNDVARTLTVLQIKQGGAGTSRFHPQVIYAECAVNPKAYVSKVWVAVHRLVSTEYKKVARAKQLEIIGQHTGGH